MVLPDNLRRIAALGTKQIFNHDSDISADGTSHQAEIDLLLQVLRLKMQHQAGYQPAHIAEINLTPAPPENASPCIARAVRQLLLMLVAEKHTHLFPIWLEEMIATNQCLPAEILPLLMTHGAYHKNLRELLLPVIGERGKWLAQIANHDEWKWVREYDAANPAYDASSMQWDKDFKQLRLHDAAAAREILEQKWGAGLIEAKDRPGFIADMKYGLALEDAPFLTFLLDDVYVGNVAARLVASLPETDLHQIVRDAAKELLIIQHIGRNHKLVIDFSWSDTFIGHPEYKSRQFARELVQRFRERWTPEEILSFIPLSYWYERWHVSSADLVEGARNSINPIGILEAWVRAADFYDDHVFAYDLLRQIKPYRLRPVGRRIVINMLTPDEKEAIAIYWLDLIKSGIDDHHPAQYIIQTIDQPWSDELLLTFLATLERSFINTVRPLLRPPLRALLEKVVTYFSLDMLDEVKRVLQLNQREELTESELEVMDGIVSGLGFHQEIIQAVRYRES